MRLSIRFSVVSLLVLTVSLLMGADQPTPPPPSAPAHPDVKEQPKRDPGKPQATEEHDPDVNVFGAGKEELGPKGKMFSNSQNANKIVFVCDASGSMINKFDAMKTEIQKAVQELQPGQSFNILFFKDNMCDVLSPKTLLEATKENKRKASTFLDGETTIGTTDPVPGMIIAFKMNPELIFFVTDGDFPDNKIVLDKFRELEKTTKVAINTIAYTGAIDTDKDFLVMLKTIADETGGKFRHVKAEDLE